MAEMDEFQSKRSKDEERLSRVFDEVMGLGPFADSSRGSATSSSSGQEDSKGAEESVQLGESTEKVVAGNGSGQEQSKGDVDASLPPIASPSSDRHSPSTPETNHVGGDSGEAEFEDTLDGLPVYGAEDEDEDWHFSLPMATLDDINMDKTDDSSQPDDRSTDTLFDSLLKEGDHEKEGQIPVTSERSQDGANTSAQTDTNQQATKSATAPVDDCSVPPPLIENIKDEPIDEGYDAALLPHTSISQIKEELESQEEELRISSVYSVGGGNTYAPATVAASGPALQTPVSVIPGKMAIPLLKPIAPVTYLSPPMALPVSQPAPLPPTPSGVRCSGCSKILMKGQTAFQRKGSTQLFCSTVCLTGHLPPTSKARCCFQCHREITQPKDMIMIPINATMYLNFCSHFCLSAFKNKRKTGEQVPVKLADKRPEKHAEDQPEKQLEKQPEKQPAPLLPGIICCSVCRVRGKIEHEVIHHGSIYKLCSNACFMSWRKTHQLAMNCCEGCGLYCKSDSGSCQTISVDKCQLNFCSPTCISTYKQSCSKTTDCGNCQKTAVISSTIMEVGSKGKIQLYCSVACVEQSRPPKHVLAGATFPCSQCKNNAVPEYHLAMVDGNILNFCSYECISIYRIKLMSPAAHKASNQPEPAAVGPAAPSPPSALVQPSHRPASSGGAAPPSGSGPTAPPDAEFPSSASCPGHHPSRSSVPPLAAPPLPPLAPAAAPGHAGGDRTPAGSQPVEDVPDHLLKLTCQECKKPFTNKPLLFSYQGRMSMFCDKICCDGYKGKKRMVAACQHCKEEKVVYDVIRYNEQELVVCSEKCKLLFKDAMSASYNEQPCRACNYCDGLGHKMLHSHYRGSMVEFCKPHCMSQYTVLYYGMARCDRCKKQISVAEKLQCSGSVRNFCDLRCLLQYCFQHFEGNQQVTSNGTGTGPALPPPHAPSRPKHVSGINPVIADVVSLASDSATQPSEAVEGAVTGALSSPNTLGKNIYNASTQTDATRRRQVKNKSVLCRPFTVDQETLCQLPAAATTESTAELASPPRPDQPPSGAHQLPARLTGRHFLGRRMKGCRDCRVCSQHKRRRVEGEDGEEDGDERKKRKMEEEVGEVGAQKTPGRRKEEERLDEEERKEEEEERKEGMAQVKDWEVCEVEEMARSNTWYYCKTCPGEPSLCPAPCFELYHTRLTFWLAPELETQALSLSSSGAEVKVKLVMVPVAVPVFIPVPMNMYSQHTPVPMAIPLPVPVPIVIPKESREMKDAAVQWEPLAEDENVKNDEPVCSRAGLCANHSREAESPQSRSDHGGPREGAVSQDSPQETGEEHTHTEGEETAVAPSTEDPSSSQPPGMIHEEGSADSSRTRGDSEERPPPSSPQMDLENDFPPELLSPASQRGVKRPRGCSSGRKRARRRTASLDRSAMVSHGRSKLNHLYGVKAWRSWVTQPCRDQDLAVKQDILQCDSTELSRGLRGFIREVRRPNGESYTPDSIFYLCLGIQQYLFEQGRIENIFTDELYSPFSMDITDMLQHGMPKLLSTGGAVTSRVEEAYLWDCKQLGAYSPLVLLNTLLYFCTKSFHLTTPAQHRRISFADVTRHSRPCSRVGKASYLRYHRASMGPSDQKDTEYSKKRHSQVEEDMELPENITNPLQCPVRLYEFYLSRCPEPAKKTNNLFYLQPLKTVNTNSPHWYTSQPLEDSILQSMLTRILAVREVQLETPEQY